MQVEKLISLHESNYQSALIEFSRKTATTWCDCVLRGDRKVMKEVKLSQYYYVSS